MENLILCIRGTGWLCGPKEKALKELEIKERGIKGNENQFRLDRSDLLDKVAAF